MELDTKFPLCCGGSDGGLCGFKYYFCYLEH